MKKFMMILLGLFFVVSVVGCDAPVKIGMTKQEVLDALNVIKKRFDAELIDESMVPKTTKDGYETWLLYINTTRVLAINIDDYSASDILLHPKKWRFYVTFDESGKVIKIVDEDGYEDINLE